MKPLATDKQDAPESGTLAQQVTTSHSSAKPLGSEAHDEFAKNELGESGVLIDGELKYDHKLLDIHMLARRWRACDAIVQLRKQINHQAQRRLKASDGTIGDANHASRTSDHNPWIIDNGVGVVSALDITHDPNGGCDCSEIVEILRKTEDTRIKYVIWDHRIYNSKSISGAAPWAWREYGGRNPHTKHFHISVKSSKTNYDDDNDWNLTPWG